MEIRINLATRYFYDTRKMNAGIVAAALVLLILLVYNIALLFANISTEGTLRKDMGMLQARFDASAKGVTEKQYRDLLQEIAAANAIINKKSLDWLLLLNRLEEVVPEGLALSSIEPSLKDGTLKLSGAARSFGVLRSLVENFESSSHFTDVLLLNQGQLSVGETQKGISFTVTCKVDFT